MRARSVHEHCCCVCTEQCMTHNCCCAIYSPVAPIVAVRAAVSMCTYSGFPFLSHRLLASSLLPYRHHRYHYHHHRPRLRLLLRWYWSVNYPASLTHSTLPLPRLHLHLLSLLRRFVLLHIEHLRHVHHHPQPRRHRRCQSQRPYQCHHQTLFCHPGLCRRRVGSATGPLACSTGFMK